MAFPTTPIRDNFSATENPKAAPWGAVLLTGDTGTTKLQSDGTSLFAVSGGPAGYGGQTYAVVFGPWVEAYYTRADSTSDNYLFFAVQPGTEGGAGTLNGYMLHDQGGHNGFNIDRYTNGANVSILTVSSGVTNAANDQWGITRVGERITVYLNGAAVGSVNDTTWVGGYFGFETNAAAGGGFKNFGAGEAVLATYAPPRIPNRRVGPTALRQRFRLPQNPQSGSYPEADARYVVPKLPNPLVGPMALRRLTRWPSVSTAVVAAAGTTQTFTFSTTSVSTPVFTPAGMTDTFTVATTGKATPAFTIAGMTDTVTFAVTGKSTPAFTLAGMTDPFTFASTGKATPAFTPAGMTDTFAVATTGKSTPAFTVAGMTDTFVFATTGKSTPAFAMAGMTDPFTLSVASAGIPSFGVSKSGGTAVLAADFPFSTLMLGG